jgi:ribosome-associated heat shock protein Hsp15
MSEDRVRIDKWLWAARFFKTRALASEAVNGGKVHLDGQRIKSSHSVKIGDSYEIQRGFEKFVIVVEQLADRRGSASVARTLYR